MQEIINKNYTTDFIKNIDYSNLEYSNIKFPNTTDSVFNKVVYADYESKQTNILKLIEDGEIQFKNTFLQIIKDSFFEYGYTTQADDFLFKKLNTIGVYVKEWISKIYLENIQNDDILIGILRVLSHFPYRMLYPAGLLIAASAINHKSDLVKENGIRAFENWESSDCLQLLKSMDVNTDWLKNYLDSVISALESL